MNHHRLNILFLIGAALFWGAAPSLFADDSEIFLVDTVAPNVVFLIDTSGSMAESIRGQRKLTTARDVVNDLVRNIDGVRFGVMAFDSSSSGARMVAPVGTDDADLIAAVNRLSAWGGTPLGRATRDVRDYFAGDYTERVRRWWRWRTVSYDSPIQFECQKNYSILVTDGLPNGEDTNLVAEVAADLFGDDHSGLDGEQNVTVHTVGFDVPEGEALLRSTAENGGGTYYAASDGDELRAALQDALSQIIEDSYGFSQPLIPSTGASGGALAYFASFRPDPSRPFWRGYLEAFRRDSRGRIPTGPDGTPRDSALAWEAGSLLAARAASDRTIYTAVGNRLESFVRTNSDVTSAMLGTGSPAERARIIDFVRGVDAFDGDLDGDTTEDRDWKLGDIFHSAPVLVFPPPPRAGDPSHDAFRSASSGRTPIVLVGANDGMLHAFRASDGRELWAFVPPNVLDRLRPLADRLGDHPYFVDADPVVTDVRVGSSWKTIAIFGQRRGGRAYFALDITDTTRPRFLWSFTDPELGETWSKPTIGSVKMADGSGRSVALFGGGYDTANNNATGRAFYVVDLATGGLLWKYSGGGSGDARHMSFSVAAPPTATDLDGDGYLDRAYVGDVGGQLWKFDLEAAATLENGRVTSWTGKRLFAADPSQPNPPAAGEYRPTQAIYGAPALAFDDYHDLWVFVGTGDRNHPKSDSANRFFGIRDDTGMVNEDTLTPDDLTDAAGNAAITQGWYRSLRTGEKVLAGSDVFHGVVYFSTYTPGTTDVCVRATGTARVYALQMETGDPGIDWPTGDRLDPGETSDPSIIVGGGIPSEPQILLGDEDDALIVATTEGEVASTTMPASLRREIRYWREVD